MEENLCVALNIRNMKCGTHPPRLRHTKKNEHPAQKKKRSKWKTSCGVLLYTTAVVRCWSPTVLYHRMTPRQATKQRRWRYTVAECANEPELVCCTAATERVLEFERTTIKFRTTIIKKKKGSPQQHHQQDRKVRRLGSMAAQLLNIATTAERGPQKKKAKTIPNTSSRHTVRSTASRLDSPIDANRMSRRQSARPLHLFPAKFDG